MAQWIMAKRPEPHARRRTPSTTKPARVADIFPKRVSQRVLDYMRALEKRGGTMSGARRLRNRTVEERREIAPKGARPRQKRSGRNAKKS